jgi:hypothetical protein
MPEGLCSSLYYVLELINQVSQFFYGCCFPETLLRFGNLSHLDVRVRNNAPDYVSRKSNIADHRVFLRAYG